MSKLEAYFQDYSSFHQTRGNQCTHLFGIPMIMITILAWASRWVLFHSSAAELPASLLQMDLGILIIGLATIWYCYLDWRVGFPFFFVLYGAYWIGRVIPNELAWTLFALGWALQLLGHYVFEKKSPAFVKNLEHLLIGPLWLFLKLLHLTPGSNIPTRSD